MKKKQYFEAWKIIEFSNTLPYQEVTFLLKI